MAFNPASYLLGVRGGQSANPFNILSNSIHSGADAGNALMHLLYGPQAYQDTHNAAVADLAAQNIKNQYMPQLQQATISHLNAPANTPLSNLNALYTEEQNETDPVKKRMLQLAIEKQVSGSKGQSINASPSGVTITQGGQPGVSGLFESPVQTTGQANGQTIVNKKTPSRGTQTEWIKNPDGTFTASTSPTTKTQSSIQNRQLGASESDVLRPNIASRVNVYAGPGGWWKMFLDGIGFHGQEGKNRLANYSAGHSVLNEYAANQLRQAGASQIGESNIGSTIEQSFPGLPPNLLLNILTNPALQNKATQISGDILHRGVNAAATSNAGGYPVVVNPSQAPADVRQAFNNTQNNGYMGFSEAEIDDYAKRSGLTNQEVKRMLADKRGGKK